MPCQQRAHAQMNLHNMDRLREPALWMTLCWVQGRLTLLLGSPGAGKSLLLNVLSGRLRSGSGLKVRASLVECCPRWAAAPGRPACALGSSPCCMVFRLDSHCCEVADGAVACVRCALGTAAGPPGSHPSPPALGAAPAAPAPQISGTMRYNGVDPSEFVLNRTAGLVDQQDFHVPTLTGGLLWAVSTPRHSVGWASKTSTYPPSLVGLAYA